MGVGFCVLVMLMGPLFFSFAFTVMWGGVCIMVHTLLYLFESQGCSC